MLSVNGELKPTQADKPKCACKTITYFAMVSAKIILVSSLIASAWKLEMTIIIPATYRTIEIVPAEPTLGSIIAWCLASLPPLVINPSAKSASASV